MAYLLTALNENGILVCLADVKNPHLLREQGEFFCPVCKEQLILKIGTKKIPHFSHLRNSTCLHHFENESEYHLLGKKKLYHWLKEMGLKPELEVYDENIQQRPDIRFIFKDKRFAIEYQCSVIPENLFKKRTEVYVKNGYTPIWILGGNQFKRKSTNIVSLTDFQYLFLASHNNVSLMPFYCPNANQFIILKKIIPVTTRNAIATVKIKAPENLSLLELINPLHEYTLPLQSWQKEIKTFKCYFTQNPQSFRDPFLKELYFNHHHLVYLPPEIGLPVHFGVFIRTPTVVWQGFIYLDSFKNSQVGDVLTWNSIYLAFHQRVLKKHVSLREIPLLDGNATFPVWEYLLTLTKCQFLERISETTFRVMYEMKPSGNIMEQEQKESLFYKNFNCKDYDFIRKNIE
jgi:competence protein CoiA